MTEKKKFSRIIIELASGVKWLGYLPKGDDIAMSVVGGFHYFRDAELTKSGVIFTGEQVVNIYFVGREEMKELKDLIALNKRKLEWDQLQLKQALDTVDAMEIQKRTPMPTQEVQAPKIDLNEVIK